MKNSFYLDIVDACKLAFPYLIVKSIVFSFEYLRSYNDAF